MKKLHRLTLILRHCSARSEVSVPHKSVHASFLSLSACLHRYVHGDHIFFDIRGLIKSKTKISDR